MSRVPNMFACTNPNKLTRSVISQRRVEILQFTNLMPTDPGHTLAARRPAFAQNDRASFDAVCNKRSNKRSNTKWRLRPQFPVSLLQSCGCGTGQSRLDCGNCAAWPVRLHLTDTPSRNRSRFRLHNPRGCGCPIPLAVLRIAKIWRIAHCI